MSNCKYCNKRILDEEGIVPMINKDFLIFGETFMEILTAIGRTDDGDCEEELYLSGYCVAKKKINFCPMCGRSLTNN